MRHTDRPSGRTERQLIHRSTRTCRAGSSFAAASAAGADAAEQVGVGVVVEAGWRGVAGEADTVGIYRTLLLFSEIPSCIYLYSILHVHVAS